MIDRYWSSIQTLSILTQIPLFFPHTASVSELVASSKTLSTQQSVSASSSPIWFVTHCLIMGKDPKVVPYDLWDLIPSHTVGQFIQETVDTILLTDLHLNFLGALAGVSVTFRAILLKLVVLAFRIPLLCESQRCFTFLFLCSSFFFLCSILIAAYSKFRSLHLFKAATLGCTDGTRRSMKISAHACAYYVRINLRGSTPKSQVRDSPSPSALQGHEWWDITAINRCIAVPTVVYKSYPGMYVSLLAAEDSTHSLGSLGGDTDLFAV
jgi:hypothetical protein